MRMNTAFFVTGPHCRQCGAALQHSNSRLCNSMICKKLDYYGGIDARDRGRAIELLKVNPRLRLKFDERGRLA